MKNKLYIIVGVIIAILIAICIFGWYLYTKKDFEEYVTNTKQEDEAVVDTTNNEFLQEYIASYNNNNNNIATYGITDDLVDNYTVVENYDNRVTLSWDVGNDELIYLHIEYDTDGNIVNQIVWSSNDAD